MCKVKPYFDSSSNIFSYICVLVKLAFPQPTSVLETIFDLFTCLSAMEKQGFQPLRISSGKKFLQTADEFIAAVDGSKALAKVTM